MRPVRLKRPLPGWGCHFEEGAGMTSSSSYSPMWLNSKSAARSEFISHFFKAILQLFSENPKFIRLKTASMKAGFVSSKPPASYFFYTSGCVRMGLSMLSKYH